MYKELKNDEPNASILFANDVSFEEYITVKYNTYKTKNMYSHCMPCFGYKNYECMSLWLPQKYFAFTEGSPTEGECDWVFRLETLERDLNQFLERYDIEPLPILHDNKTHPRNYMDYYNDKTKDYVYKMEKELIEVYKYEF